MVISRQEGPRSNQKERTRAALVEAAAGLLREGSAPTVAEAAERAKVSRATAYRYFPTPEALLVEVVNVTPATAPVESMLADLSGDDIEQRMLQLVDTFTPIVLAEEAPMRAALRVYLDTWLDGNRDEHDAPTVREGRRMRWLDTVLEPATTLSAQKLKRLQSALALTLGIDAIVVLKDVCHLDDDETAEVLRWAASALVRSALDEQSALAEQ